MAKTKNETSRVPRGVKRAGDDRAAPVRASFIDVMKARGVEAVPAGEWHCEIKYDGYRAVSVINGDDIQLWSRARQRLTEDYPGVVAALRRLQCRSAVLDGEIVAVDEQGRSRFELLQARGDPAMSRPIVYFVFDVLQRDGVLLVQEPIERRREHLAALLRTAKGAVQLSPVVDTRPAHLLEAARKLGLEGIIAKRFGSRYEPGLRSGAWLKCKVVAEQEFVIGGFTEPRRSRTGFGAILVGYYENGRLVYAGKVGSGFDAALLRGLHAEFRRRKAPACPFVNLPQARKPRFGSGLTAAVMRHVTWVRPEMVAQVKFAEWTRDGMLRQPVFLGLRTDKPAKAVRREAGPVSQETPATGRV